MKRLTVFAALVVAVAACGGGDDGASDGFSNPAFGDVTVSGALPPLDDPAADSAVGQEAPSLSGVDPNGDTVEFTPGANSTVLVFVAHWCPHCQTEVPLIVDWMEANPDRLGIDVIAVATGTAQGQPNYPPADWLARENWDQPIIMDDEASSAGAAFGLTSYPFWVIVDSDGRISRRAAGALGAEQIDALMTEVSEL